jgi:hypothetical protein
VNYLSICSGIEAATVTRFMAKVDVRGPDECWVWTAARHSSGYGKFGSGGHKGRTLLAHRFSYQIYKDLWLGSADENNADMVRKGRSRGYDKSGERNPGAKITRDQALEIRRRAIAGENQRILAAAFGVSRNLVSEIKRGKVWA